MLLMAIAVIAVTLGDIWMSQTMKSVGEVRISSLTDLGTVAGKVLSIPKFWLAVTCMAMFFFIWTSILSYADLTFVLPLTALTYVLNALLAPWLLNEVVTPTRWLGVGLISAGVALVALSEAWQKAPQT
jgi:drug/metabolite transporter (DMT)-like permease